MKNDEWTDEMRGVVVMLQRRAALAYETARAWRRNHRAETTKQRTAAYDAQGARLVYRAAYLR